MFKKKGFTLIEVIVSMALLGIIALGFLGAINNNLNFLRINKNMTVSAFLDQKDMELEILKTKADIKDGTISAGSFTTLTNVFESGVNVKSYQLKYDDGKQNIYTLVTDTRLPEFKVPIAQNVNAQLRTNTTNVNYAYAAPETNVYGSSSIDPTTTDVFMINNYGWYVSRQGFNIPMPDTAVPEIEIGNKYPKFPEDYSLIPTSATVNLSNVTAYGGRHIVFAVTPAAKSGRMGKTVPSNPVYVSGLPVNGSNLVLHLDASIVSDTDTSQITTVGGELYVQKWNDLTINAKNALQGTQSNRPKLKEHPVGGDFVGKYVDFDASKNLSVQHDSIRNTSLYVFAVVKGNDTDVFYNSNSKTNINGNEIEIIGVTGQWKIVYFQYTSPDQSASNKITLGNSDVDVAELIVYKGTFTEVNKNTVIEYLKGKYIPMVVVGNIVQLRPLTDVEVIKDEYYMLSSAVLAEMEHGSDRFVPVTWVPNAVNTSSLGTYTFTATAVNDNTKTTTLKVTVKDRVPVSSISLNVSNHTIYVGDNFELISTILPADATNKAITWSSSNTSVATLSSNGSFTSKQVNGVAAGTAVITVKTEDGNKTATCNVTVKNKGKNIDIVSAKYVTQINSTNESSNAVVVTFSEPINLKSVSTFLNDFKTTSDFFGKSNKINSVVKSTLDPNSIIVSFSENIYNTFSPFYLGTKDNNKIDNDSIRTTGGEEVEISNGSNFTIKDEILKYNTDSTQYRIITKDESKALDVEGSSTSTTADKIIIYDNKKNNEANQLWYISNYSSDITHSIRWKSGSTNYYLRENGQNANIRQGTSANTDRFKWIIERYRDASNGIAYYTIKPQNFGNRYFGVTSLVNVTYFRLLEENSLYYYKWMIVKK